MGVNGYLLDTHTFLWALSDPSKLGKEGRTAIENNDYPICVSAASAWEISTKFRIGKLPGASTVLDDFDQHVDRLGAVELRIGSNHALLSGSLDWGHRDPFDRMLAAQALTESLTLITRDGKFHELPQLQTLW